MNQQARLRAPWVVWTLVMATLVATLILVGLNGTYHNDTFFIPLAILMMVGYSTVGALLASRLRGNPIGWLMMIAGAGFLAAAFSSEYVTWALRTSPGPHPLVDPAIAVNNSVFILAIAPIPLLLLWFPTGRSPTRNWRWLPPALVIVLGLGTLASFVHPGSVDINPGVQPPNPYGLESLRSVIGPVQLVAGIGGIVLSLLPVLALIRRFRAARDDERQQIRWLAYVAAVGGVFFLFTIVTAIGLHGGQTRAVNELSFYAFFGCVGIGIPAATGIAVLRYRLWDLDLVIKKTVVFAIFAAFFTLIYVVVLLAVPTLVFGVDKGFSPLVFGTTIVIAILFQPVRTRARRLADRLVYGRRATPYEVLSEFSERLSDAYSTDDVLPRMAQLLAAGTGAVRATVWLRVGPELRPAATAPFGADPPESRPATGDDLPPFDEPSTPFPVRHQGELLGVITLDMAPNDPMDPEKERLVLDVAGQAGLVLRNVRLIEELRASRRRIVSAQDERAKALERNIHDGAQQQLVALSVKLRLAEGLARKDPEKTAAMLLDLQAEATDALENLRDLARGIYPPLLADQGLAPALEAQARKVPIPIVLETDGIGRFAQDVESAIYFSCLEALQNATKYSNATRIDLHVETDDGNVRFEVRDDGRGFDSGIVAFGTGLQGIVDRLAALGGSIEVRSAPDQGTTVTGRVPARPS